VPPRTQYARHGDREIAYKVVGEGDVEIVWIPSFVSHIEFYWTDASIKSWIDRIASFSRVVIFDKLGTGCSDPVDGIPTVEDRAAEIESVVKAVGMECPVLFGLSEGGPSSIYYAATHPGKVRALLLFGTFPRGATGLESPADAIAALRESGIEEKYLPTGPQIERVNEFQEAVFERWGEGEALECLVPSFSNRSALALLERLSASPGMARATITSGAALDVTDLLPTVSVPTLVVHATDDLVPVGWGRFLADKIPNARLIEVEGRDHAPWLSDPERIVGEIEEFLTGTRHAADPTRALMTVLFTDIVGSTERAADLGDARWRSLLGEHDRLTKAAVARYDGRAVKSTGDGYLATFDGPVRAIRCAEELIEELGGADLEIRAGIHTGEVEVIGDDIGGMAVHLAARVNALAEPGEILASRTVRDLVVGSGVAFVQRGEPELKGVPGRWELVAVAREGEVHGDHEEASIAEIETPNARDNMRPRDRMAATMARRAPGMMRTLGRLTTKS